MKVELKIDSNCIEPYVVICASKMTNNIQTAISILENDKQSLIITGEYNDKYFVIETNMIEVVKTNGKDVMIHTIDNKVYKVNKTLYELQDILGNDFVRISKSSIVCIKQISHVSASFNGTMEIVMKSKMFDVITRSFKKEFMKRIGV